MPYISKARLEHIKLEAKIDVLKLAIVRSKGDAYELHSMVMDLVENLTYMRSVLERNARL